MSARLKCESCGGAVEYSAKEQAAACLFCGLESLVLADDDDQPFGADLFVPMVLDQGKADAAYRAWARASWWRPAALRDLRVQTRPVYLPAWRFVCDLDTHWAGLRRAATASGKAPKTGRERLRMEHVVPASGGLEAEELWALWPFDTAQGRPVGDQTRTHEALSGVPHELPAKSRKRAAAEVHQQVQSRHRDRISQSHGLTRCHVMSRVEDVDAETMLLPVFVGVFRFRDRPWRFVINAQTGEVHGKAPVDRLKVVGVVLGVVTLLSLIALLVGR